MKTIYPSDPIKDFNEWREYIRQQVLTAHERRVLENFKLSIIKNYNPK